MNKKQLTYSEKLYQEYPDRLRAKDLTLEQQKEKARRKGKDFQRSQQAILSTWIDAIQDEFEKPIEEVTKEEYAKYISGRKNISRSYLSIFKKITNAYLDNLFDLIPEVLTDENRNLTKRPVTKLSYNDIDVTTKYDAYYFSDVVQLKRFLRIVTKLKDQFTRQDRNHVPETICALIVLLLSGLSTKNLYDLSFQSIDYDNRTVTHDGKKVPIYDELFEFVEYLKEVQDKLNLEDSDKLASSILIERITSDYIPEEEKERMVQRAMSNHILRLNKILPSIVKEGDEFYDKRINIGYMRISIKHCEFYEKHKDELDDDYFVDEISEHNVSMGLMEISDELSLTELYDFVGWYRCFIRRK